MTLPAEATPQTRAALLSEAINNTFEEQGATFQAEAKTRINRNKKDGADLLEILHTYSEAAAGERSVVASAHKIYAKSFTTSTALRT